MFIAARNGEQNIALLRTIKCIFKVFNVCLECLWPDLYP